ELKQAAYVWLTDFVGWLPMPAHGERDVALTADYNAEMIEHVERFPRLRDRAIFIGRPEDEVPGTFGLGLPEMRAWTERHYEFTGGYILGLQQKVACDVAVTQGGLSLTMELTAAGRPFLYCPLRDHCEQNFHVKHRLERYRAGRCMDFDEATPSKIADAIQALVSQPVDYLEVEGGTAARAAELIAELL